MQIFVKSLAAASLVVEVEEQTTVDALLVQLATRDHALKHAYLCHNGRKLEEDATVLASVGADATLHAAWRLAGGKGGFGNLLRGQGRDGKVTTNFDACRDLSGRRLRHKNGEKKMAEWAAQAKERELEKLAQQHIKETERAARAQERDEAHEKALAEARALVTGNVGAAVASGLRVAKRPVASSGAASGSKRARRARFAHDDDSDDSSDDDSDGEDAALDAEAGDGAGDESVHAAAAAVAAAAAAAAGAPPTKSPSSSDADDDARTAPPSATVLQPPREAGGAAASPAPSSSSPSSSAPSSSAAAPSSSAAAPSSSARSSSRASSATDADAPLVDLRGYATVGDLEGLGMAGLAAQLGARGMKAGGTLTQRAARLWLARSTPVAELDSKHLAKRTLR